MAQPTVRVLFLADTHLGIDLPARPKIARRRRGYDFLANYQRAVQAARKHHVHAVIHGGDVFYRSRVRAEIVQTAFAPLKRLAEEGIPVYVVPGNHERSVIPHAMLALHRGIHVFDRPRTFVAEWNGVRVALAGFPFCRRGVRGAFRALLRETAWESTDADVNLLCVHQCFEGATVGPHGFTFRYADDVVRAEDVPIPFAAVLAGHIHRHQVLTTDLDGHALPTPILYPGSIERTSFAERGEDKGYLVLELEPGADRGGTLTGWTFHRLPARPMVTLDLEAHGIEYDALHGLLAEVMTRAPADAVLRIRVHGVPAPPALAALRAAHVRDLAPATMNVEVMLVDMVRGG